MKGFLTICAMAMYVATAWMLAGGPLRQPGPARLGRVDIVVPKSCQAQIMKWTSGKSDYTSTIEQFVTLKEEVEGCGGKVTMESK